MSNESSPSPPPTQKESKDVQSIPPSNSNSNSSPPPPTKDLQYDKDSKHDASMPPSNSNSSPPLWSSSSKTTSGSTASPPQSSPPTPSKSPPPSPPPPTPSRKQSPSPPPPPNKTPPSPPPPSQNAPNEQSQPPQPLPSADATPQSPPQKTPPPPLLSPPPSSTTIPTPPPPSNTLEASTSLPVVSPTPANVSIRSSPGISPDALASQAVPIAPHSSSNASDGSSPSGGSSNQTQNKTINVKTHNHGVIVDVTIAGAVVLVAFVAFFFFIKRRDKKQPSLPGNHTPLPVNVELKSDVAYYKSKFDGKESTLVNSSEALKGPNYHGPESGFIAGSMTFFTYEELMEMTDGFSRENIIGEGGFGCVYKGRIPEGGRLVAVKQLKVGSGQGEREFKAEVEIISRIHHRHLVSLVGYCIAENQRLLIYDYVGNKTLEHHLHGKDMPVLEWANRVKIAIGAAKGLAYLHEDCQPRIIHRDIKSANILLDDDFGAQVADFGLARLNDTSQTHVSTRVMGTFGYLAPEYASTGKLTDKSDVFSFGVVLLELITGRKPIDSTQPLGDESLVEWGRPVLIQAIESGDISGIIDQRLEKRYVESEVLMMIEVAAACVRHSAAKRPRMSLVLRALDYEGWDLSNGVKVGESFAYDSGKYSEEIAEFRKMAQDSFSSEFDINYNEEFSSREMSHGRSSWKSEYSSSEFTSSESDTNLLKKNGSGHSDGGTSGIYDSGRFK